MSGLHVLSGVRKRGRAAARPGAGLDVDGPRLVRARIDLPAGLAVMDGLVLGGIGNTRLVTTDVELLEIPIAVIAEVDPDEPALMRCLNLELQHAVCKLEIVAPDFRTADEERLSAVVISNRRK